jgi:hypothetical protein
MSHRNEPITILHAQPRASGPRTRQVTMPGVGAGPRPNTVSGVRYASAAEALAKVSPIAVAVAGEPAPRDRRRNARQKIPLAQTGANLY